MARVSIRTGGDALRGAVVAPPEISGGPGTRDTRVGGRLLTGSYRRRSREKRRHPASPQSFVASLEQEILHLLDVVAPAACGQRLSSLSPMITLDRIAPLCRTLQMPSTRKRWEEYTRGLHTRG